MNERYQAAILAIDRANACDTTRLSSGSSQEPKEIVHGRMVSDWILRLLPEASEALRLAGRAHHLERWKIPRASYPDGREGYLLWRRDLQDHHVQRAREILADLGYDDALLERVETILRKRRLRSDPEVQCFEDALCLVFLETQFRDLAHRLGEDKMVEVLRRTLVKMSPHGKRAATEIALPAGESALLAKALETS